MKPPYELRLPHWMNLLMNLYKDSTYVTKLSKRMNLSYSTTIQIANVLIKKKIIWEVYKEKKKFLHLTTKGEELVDNIFHAIKLVQEENNG